MKGYLDLRREFDQLKANSDSIPIGFIYFELPFQSTPHQIWPKYQWSYVTSRYSNLFFRAEGNETAFFGQVQRESLPSLGISVTKSQAINSMIYPYNVQLSPGKSTLSIFTGGDYKSSYWYVMSFGMNTTDVRPKNTAIRIWKRIQ